MSAFGFEKTLRWARRASRRTLARRDDQDLPFVGSGVEPGSELLLDTCVYIDRLQDRTPAAVEHLIERHLSSHSTVAIQELMQSVGALDPVHPGTATAIRYIGAAIDGMPPHRILTPDAETLGRAALLAGILSRLQGYQRDQRFRAIQDCTLFLKAQKHGLTLLTANVADFDILLQMIPAGRVLFYRRTESTSSAP